MVTLGPIYILHHHLDTPTAQELAQYLTERGFDAHFDGTLKVGEERLGQWKAAIDTGAYCVVIWSNASSGSGAFHKLVSNLLDARIRGHHGPNRPTGYLGIHPLEHAAPDDPPPTFSLLQAYKWDTTQDGLAQVADRIRVLLSPTTQAEQSGAREHQFLECIRHKCAFLPVGGFPQNVRIPLDVERTYVPLRAWRRQALTQEEFFHVGARHQLPPEAIERDVSIDEAIAASVRRDGRCGVAVLGEPGSGKSTLLKHLVLALTDPAHGPLSLGLPPQTIPLWLPLRHAPRASEGFDATIEGMLQHLQFPEPGPMARGLAQRRHLLVLLDGLDELPTQQAREAVSGWVSELAGCRPDVFFVVTSRYTGWKGDARLDGRFEELHVRPLERLEVEQFVHRWFSEVERQVQSLPPEYAEAEAFQAADRLLRESLYCEPPPEASAQEKSALAARLRSLHELAGNPLLLHVICLTHRLGQRLPEARVDLLKLCVEVLVEGWLRTKGHRLAFTAKEALELLEPVAWAIQTQPDATAELPWDQIEPLFCAALQRLGRPQNEANLWLERLCHEAGVLVDLGQARYSFLHLSFQAYLAACHAKSSLANTQEPLHILAGHFGDPRWQEITLLACGLTQPDLFEPLMTQVLQSGAAGRHPDWLDACLLDAAVRPRFPFWRAVADPSLDVDTRYHALRVLRSEWQAGRLVLSPEQKSQLRRMRNADESTPIQALLSELVGEPRRSPGAKPKAGDTWTNPVDGSVLVYVPEGRYPMGASDLHEACGPEHYVYLGGFWIGRYPVTNAQWARYREAMPSAPEPEFGNDKKLNAPEQPVVGISWHEAVAYCKWAALALPSEAQWEAAARGPEGRHYPWGNESPTAEHANFGGNIGHPSPVGRYALGEGPFGTFDQAGNVWEWCADIGIPDAYKHRQDGVRNPVNLRGDFEVRALRGGCWSDSASDLRAAYRLWDWAWLRFRSIGFRVVRVLPPALELGA